MKAKAASAKIAELCPEIRWHFIGTIQKKSLNHILKADKLTGIQTVTSIEVIDMIEKRLSNEVNIMLQVKPFHLLPVQPFYLLFRVFGSS